MIQEDKSENTYFAAGGRRHPSGAGVGRPSRDRGADQPHPTQRAGVWRSSVTRRGGWTSMPGAKRATCSGIPPPRAALPSCNGSLRCGRTPCRSSASTRSRRSPAGGVRCPVLDRVDLDAPPRGIDESGRRVGQWQVHLARGHRRPDPSDVGYHRGSKGPTSPDSTRPGGPGAGPNTIGVVLQSGNLIPFLDASENVELAMRVRRPAPIGLHAPPSSSTRSASPTAADHLPRQLSGGEAQRVASRDGARQRAETCSSPTR